MKKASKTITCLAISFLVLSCSEKQTSSSSISNSDSGSTNISSDVSSVSSTSLESTISSVKEESSLISSEESSLQSSETTIESTKETSSEGLSFITSEASIESTSESLNNTSSEVISEDPVVSSSESIGETSTISSNEISSIVPEESSEPEHIHTWSATWSFDDENHWLTCKDKTCDEISGLSVHDFGEWEDVDSSTLKGAQQYAYSNPRIKRCQTCQYAIVEGTNILPEIRFTSDVESEISFATTAKKDDIDRPEIQGKISITNCDEKYQRTDLVASMKVRGNQTANWSKKAFRIKLDKKDNLLGLNGGPDNKGFKKWVLLADAKDTALIRSALGLYISKAICADVNNIWVSNFTPVSVYLNDQYWGYYYLAEQKEVKEGRINLPAPKKNAGIDIGYCFEMDYYATKEPQKADGGDPTFKIDYGPETTRNSYKIESVLANYGPMNTYTMLSDITDSTAGENRPINDTNSVQVAFMKKRLESLYRVLYEASKNNVAKTIDENNDVVDSDDSVQKVIEDNFDLATWADGFIINAFDCAPDLGYSSFYMSYDNTSEGAKKLRYDNPWDFDSNFGNRSGFIPTADTASSSSGGWGSWGGSGTSYDPYYMDRTSNMWLQLLGKMDFFMDIVKTRWNQLREDQVFEHMFQMMRTYFADYDAEIHRNHYRWPTNDAANELRDPFKNTSQYKQAEEETINWCAKRINYLENKWGQNRPNIVTE